MTKTLEAFFLYGAIYTALLPFFLFLVNFKKAKTEAILVLVFAYSIVEFLTNIIALVFEYKIVIFFYSIFTILEFWFFSLILRRAIKKEIVKKYILLSGIAFTFFAITYYLSIKTKGLDSIPIGVETILILSTVFFFLFEQMADVSQQLIYSKFSFWIVVGILIYLSGSFFIYILSNQVSEEVRNAYWMFTNIFTILKNIAFSIGIFLFVKKIKIPSAEYPPYLN